MSSVPFILETLRAQGLILLWVRRDEKFVLLNQVPSSLSWTAAQNIWVQNHIETVTKADARVTLTQRKSRLDWRAESASYCPWVSFCSSFLNAWPFTPASGPSAWPLVPGCWRLPLASARSVSWGATPSASRDRRCTQCSTTAPENKSHIQYQTRVPLAAQVPTFLHGRNYAAFPHFKTQNGSLLSVASHTHTHAHTQWVLLCLWHV